MKPYYQDKWVAIYHGDCREILPSLDSASAIVTDPPYELGFMGKSWDSKGISFQPETWGIIRRVCLSGAPLLSFAGTRTFHRIACAIEDAGWEIRDTLMWVYGSGFPKSKDVSKALDEKACHEELEKELGRKPTKEEFKARWEHFREVVGHYIAPDGKWRDCRNHKPNEEIRNPETHYGYETSGFRPIDAPATPEAQLWKGYGTALKPAYEPIILAMNPLDGTFANNAVRHGVAGLNIDSCRIEGPEPHHNYGRTSGNKSFVGKGAASITPQLGRFPANFIHDGSQMVMELFPETKSGMPGIKHRGNNGAAYGAESRPAGTQMGGFGDSGSAARFFYCAKASKAERNKGCEGLELRQPDPSRKAGDPGGDNPRNRGVHKVANSHPTVKPLALMQYLCKLVKYPEYNLVIDPFCGSGSTLLACIKVGIPCIGIDSDENSCEIAAKRCSQEIIDAL